MEISEYWQTILNFISPLGAGEMLIREKDNKETSYYISGGFLEVRQIK